MKNFTVIATSVNKQEQVMQMMYSCLNLPTKNMREQCTKYWATEFDKQFN